MENLQNTQAATPEAIWAILMETAQLQKENEKRWEELRQSQKELQKTVGGITNNQDENEKSRADFDRRMKEIQKMVGGISENQGLFAEEYFFNSFESGKTNFFGEKFDIIKKKVTSVWQGVEDEYDIVLYNHSSVAIIEVKYKAHKNDIPDVLKKAETFKILYPYYKDFKIYLGLASMSFYPELEQECIEQGIAVIKQVGDKVVINDTNLKVF